MNFPQHIGKALTVEEKRTFQKVRARKKKHFESQINTREKRELRRKERLHTDSPNKEEQVRLFHPVLYEAVGELTNKVYYAAYSHAEVSQWLSQFCLYKDERLAHPVRKQQQISFPETIKIKRSYSNEQV